MVLFALVWFAIIAGVVFAVPVVTNFFPDQQWLPIILLINILFIIGLPLVSIVMGVSRLAFRRARLSRGWRTGMSTLWGLNMVSFFLVASLGARNFSAEGENTRNLSVAEFAGDTLTITSFKARSTGHTNIHFGPWSTGEMDFIPAHVEIHRAEDGEWRLEEVVHSRGKTVAEAKSLAQALRSEVRMATGRLELPRSLTIDRVPKYRGHHLTYKLYVPDGAVIQPSAVPYVAEVSLHDIEGRGWNRSDYQYQMKEDGLHCLNCQETEEAEAEAADTPEADTTATN